jgi:hypothetical protein
MSVHDLARAASADLRSHTVADVDAGLDALLVAHDRRRRHSRFAIGLVAAAAVLVAWWGVAGLDDHRTRSEPADHTPGGRGVCADAQVTCLGNRTYRFSLDSPIRWHIPRGFGVGSGAGVGDLLVESYWSHHGNNVGVTVMERVRTASQKTSTDPAPGVPATAAGFVGWLASRPYLHATTPRPISLDGHDGWRVRVSRRGSATGGPAMCLGDTTPCRAVTSAPIVTGMWGDLVADYVVVDLPGSGTLVAWSWATGHDTRALALNRTLIDGITLSG